MSDLHSIVATCTRCGAEGLLVPHPLPRGSFQCPNCTVPRLALPAFQQALAEAKARAAGSRPNTAGA